MTIVPHKRGVSIEAFFDADGNPDGGMFSTLVVCNAIVVFRDVMSREECVVYENLADFPTIVAAFRQGMRPGHEQFATVIEGDGREDFERLASAIRDNLAEE